MSVEEIREKSIVYTTILIIIIVLLIFYKEYSKIHKRRKEEKELNEDTVNNTEPIKVKLFDVIEYTQHKFRGMENYCTVMRLIPIFKDISTGQLYINSRFDDLGDMILKYDYPPNELPKLILMTKKGRMLQEDDTGTIYIKRITGIPLYSDGQLDLGHGKYKYKGKLINYTDAYQTKEDEVFNIMKDNFIEEVSKIIESNNALIVDTIIDFDNDGEEINKTNL